MPVTVQGICHRWLILLRASPVDPMRGYNRRLSSPTESSLPMYTLARQLLFKLSPETSHDLSPGPDRRGRAFGP